MAHIVAGFGVPHNPFLPVTIPKDPDGLDGRLYDVVREHFEAVDPEVVVAFCPDHLNTFFYDNLPTFAVAEVDELGGPNDESPGLSYRTVRSHRALGRTIHAHGIEAGFDLARVQKLEVDHALMVPLHFLAPERDVCVVPIIMNVLAPPIPTAPRARALGRAVGDAVRAFPEDLRVAVLANGGINQEVAGPRSLPGTIGAAPDREWLEHVIDRLRGGEGNLLAEEATRERLANAGNAAGEILTVLAMLAAIGDGAPTLLEANSDIGHAYGVWGVDSRP